MRGKRPGLKASRRQWVSREGVFVCKTETSFKVAQVREDLPITSNFTSSKVGNKEQLDLPALNV